MDTIHQLINVLLGVISAGTGFRIVFCAIRRGAADESEIPQMNKRIKHSIVFFILALSALSLSNVVKYYFG